MRVLLGIIVLALALLATNVSAPNFTDSTGSGFDLGVHINTTADPVLGLTLANETVGAYYTNGSFTSRAFDAGQVASWDSAAINITVNASEQAYSILYSASNDSITWSSWNGLPQMGRYLNYSLNISSLNNQTRPAIDMVNITYSFIPSLVSPVFPADGNTTGTSSVLLNCSASSVNGLKNISIYWNESNWLANHTANATGFYNYTTLSLSGFPAGAYKWACIAYDNQSNMAWGANSTIYYQPITSAPAISYNISSPIITNGTAVSLAMYASSSSLSSVWINLSYPNASAVRLGLSNGGYVNFTPPVAGAYGVTFFANDTSGNTSNASSSFTAVTSIPINLSVTGRNGASLVSNVTFYYAGTSTQAAYFSSSTGDYGSRAVPNTSCDVSVNAYDGRLNIRLLGVDMLSNANKAITLDNPSVSGFIAVYAINSSYSMGSARIRVSYSGTNVSSEGTLKMQKCADWNFSSSSCASGWADVASASVYTDADYVQADLTGFSAYGLGQGGYCGDGVCGADEGPANCSADCTCINGNTRACSVAHLGQCAVGTETCAGGVWAGCPAPAAEACNQLDDDCDGIIDNVGGGASVEATSCQCYGGGMPVNEACNGIDDNCDGQIDENIQSQCGSDVGACTFGMKTCANGVFTNCTGGVQPIPEICGNDADDDCDGQTDEGCASSAACQWGLIPETGCRCGNTTYASGYCCSGSYQTEPCARIPWELLIIFGVAGAVIGIFIHVTRKKNRESSWKALEKKYTPV